MIINIILTSIWYDLAACGMYDSDCTCQNNAKKYKKYPKIQEGDMVRVNIKQIKFSKYHEPNWSSIVHVTLTLYY